MLSEVDLLSAEGREGEVRDAEVAPRGRGISGGHGAEVYGGAAGVGSGRAGECVLDEHERGNGPGVDAFVVGHRERNEIAVQHEVE